MAVTLLSLPEGTSSLEFVPEDIEAVRQAISDLFGDAISKRDTTYSQVAFGGETFLFEMNGMSPA
jgi:hypothetical protein